MKLSGRDLLMLRGIEVHHADRLKGLTLGGVSTDSRTIRQGELFVAIRGENFDGNMFIDDAVAKGAAAVIAEGAASSEVPGVVVENATRALGELARLYRMRFKIPVLVIAGSNGKTTTKDMIAHVLGAGYNVLSTEGNLNNQIGVPRMLFKLERKHDVAVLEIGTNHPGEIEYLCNIVSPTHGLVTNVGREHLEFFKSIAGVADEECTLFDVIKSNKRSTAFVNADDKYTVERSRGIKRRITYGVSAQRVGIRGKIIGADESGAVKLRLSGVKLKKPLDVQLAVPGDHNALNAVAAATVGLSFKISPLKVKSGLESFRPSSKRMEVFVAGGITIYNDTYNANPDSTLAALKTLATAKVPGKKIAVLADMLELGERAEEEHARIGRQASKLGLDYCLTYGDQAAHFHAKASFPFAVHYDQKNMLAEFLAELVSPGDAVLVKGSRGMRMEDIVTFLRERLHDTATS